MRIINPFQILKFVILCLCVGVLVVAEVQADPQAPIAPSQNISAAGLTSTLPDPVSNDLRGMTVELIIERQLRAFREKKASIAFSLVSEELQNQYHNADHFMMMMVILNKPITKHVSYNFKERTIIDGHIIQKVNLIADDNDEITVMIRLNEDPQMGWRIDSYTILDAKDAQPI